MFTFKKQQTDHDGGILILDVSINDSKYILINLYNANTEKKQIEVLINLFALLKTFDIDPNNHLTRAGNINLFFNSKLDVVGENPTVKRKSLATFIELEETYDLCHIWRIRNTKVKQFTFTQQLHQVLFNADLITDLFRMVFKNLYLQQILNPISTDHSSVSFSRSKEKGNIRGKSFCKFSSSLTKDQNYINEIKDLIRNFNTRYDCNFSRELKWELLKYQTVNLLFIVQKALQRKENKK